VNIKKNISGIEYTSIGLSVLGSIAAIVTQQIACIAAPLTLSLSLSLINRQKELVKANQRLANLEQQLIALPAAPTTVDFHRLSASVSADGQELKRLRIVLTEIENRDRDISPFLTEIDLTKDSLKQLSLNFSNFEKEFNHRQDAINIISTEQELGEIRTTSQTRSSDVGSKADFMEHSLKFTGSEINAAPIYLSVEQIKLKLQFLEESSKVSEDAIKQIGWRFLELEQEFADRQELIEIDRLTRSLVEIDNNIQTIRSEFSITQTDNGLRLTGLEVDRDRLHNSMSEAKLTIQLLEANSIAPQLEPEEVLQRISDLDASLGDLHDYSLRLNNRIENYLQHDRSEIVDLVISDQQIHHLIKQEIESQFDLVKQALPTNCQYDLIYGRAESRQVFLEALQQSQERLILVCPWLTNYAINADVRELMRAALDRGVSIEIGWGHLKDVDNNRSYLSQAELLKSNEWSYNAIPWLSELQVEYSRLLRLKILGTHEKFLVCDRQFAMLGSHNYLTSDTKSSEREVGLKTDSPELIDKLVELFDRAEA
jgi:PLD-like domain